jgi:hypothetical protein
LIEKTGQFPSASKRCLFRQNSFNETRDPAIHVIAPGVGHEKIVPIGIKRHMGFILW